MAIKVECLRAVPQALPAGLITIGILLADQFSLPFGWWAVGGLLTCGFGFHPRFGPWGLTFCLVFAGAARLAYLTTPWSPLDLRSVCPPEPMLCQIQGRITEPLGQHTTVFRGKETIRTSVSLQIESLKAKSSEWRSAVGPVVASVQGALPKELTQGARVEVTGVLQRPEKSGVPGTFDYRAYLERSGIYFTLAHSSTADWRLIEPERSSTARWKEQLQSWGRRTLALGLPEEDQALHLIWAMTLGWKPGLDRALSQPFVQSGTLHVFAISGLHIALIAWIIIGAFLVIGIPRRVSGCLVIPLLWGYTAVTDWQASAIRSSVMMSVVALGWVIQRPGNVLNSLAGAAVLLLLWDPQQLFQPGSQLSFCVVFCLATLGDAIQSWFERYCFRPDLIPQSHQPRWKPYWIKAKRGFLSSLSVSLAAWVGSLPLIAWYFHIMNPISLLANLVVVPLSSICLASSLASLVCGPVWQTGSELFNHSSWFWMELMMKASAWSGSIPGGWFYVPQPSPLLMITYYSVLALLWLGGRISRFARTVAIWMVGGLMVGVCAQPLLNFSTSRIHLLPRRGGLTAFIDPERLGKEWLIDPGDEWSVETTLDPFLRSVGANHIDQLIVTHASTSCVGGALLLEDRFRISNRIGPQARFRSQPFRRWLDREQQDHHPVGLLTRGSQLGPWQVIHPSASKHSPSADDSPLVLRGLISDVQVLWVPPLSPLGQNQLIESGQDLKSDLVIAQVPSRGEALLDALLRRIDPKVIVVGDVSSAASGRRGSAWKERLRRGKADVYFVSETGYIEIQLRLGTIRLNPSTKPQPIHQETLPENSEEEK